MTLKSRKSAPVVATGGRNRASVKYPAGHDETGGIRTLRKTALILVLAFALAPSANAIPLLGIPEAGPELPTATEPIAVITVLEDEVYSYTGGFRGRHVDVPTGWNRVVLEFTETPLGDPWDRTFAASIAGVEVLRGTTPRAPMTIEKDVTRYAALLPQGGSALVEGYTDTYVAAMSITLKLRFYDDPTGIILATSSADEVVGVQRFGGLCTETSFTRSVDFGAGAPAGATLELFMSGHGAEEFWFQNSGGPRIVRVWVDGTEVATIVMLPYTYAFLGFAGPDGTAGPQEVLIHQAMWWTAQQGLDKAGVHVNSGEIPPFRATIHPDELPLLAGIRDVRISMEAAFENPVHCTWTTSASFLLDN